MSSSRRLSALALATLAASVWLGWGDDAWTRHRMRARAEALWAAHVYDEATFHRAEVRHDDLLAELPEEGETFAELAAVRAPGSSRPQRVEVAVLERVDPAERAAIDRACQLLARVLGVEVVPLDASSLALEPTRADDGAWVGLMLASALASPGALRVAFVRSRLSAGEFPWVFGVTDPDARASVVSLEPLPHDESLALELAIVMLHEVGHALGLAHCTFYECVMTPAATVARATELGARFCPVCLRKLAHVLGRSGDALLAAFEEGFDAAALEGPAEAVRAQQRALAAHGRRAPWDEGVMPDPR